MDHNRTPPSEREQKQLRALRQRKNRELEGRFLAEGIRVVEDLLESPIDPEWVLTSSTLEDSERGLEILSQVQRLRIPCRVLPEDRFLRLAPTENSQGIIAVAPIPVAGWTDIPDRERSVVLLLDAVQDPGNLGTLVRTAEALGAAAVVVLPGSVDPWNEKSVRAAAGSSFRVPILMSSWAEAARWMSEHGYRSLGAAVGGDPPGGTAGRVGLVLGNEGAGLSAETRAAVDGTIGIPLRGRAESLNVAAAAAILLYELTR